MFDYLLKDKEQPDGKRLGAEVLRGDIDNQAMLIDSLDFKQKYTSGCLSFTEIAEEVTQEQKNALMDGFEQTIRAGLDVDRVSVSWIEHRDKGRLELNFVFANVDLEHGRAFQPYVHSVDKRRVNAWKDMQNIEHGFTDPSDPVNKRLMAQRDNLPRDIKDTRQAITDGLKALVVEGVITNRDDVIQALTDGGFEIARETAKAISIKNPTGKRNIRLTGGLYERDFKFSPEVQNTVERTGEDYRARSTERYDEAKRLYDSEIARKRDYHQARHGKPRLEQRAAARDVSKASNRYESSPRKLYERDFNFSREIQNTVTAASKDYRAGSRDRYDAAKQLYDSEITRKRDYHQARHGKPRYQQRAVARDVSQASNRYEYSTANLFKQRPSPYHPAFRPVRRRRREDDRRLHTAYRPADRAARGQDSASHQIRNEKMGNRNQYHRSHGTGIWHNDRSSTGQQVLKADLHHSKATTADTAADQLRAEVDYGQETTRASTGSPTGATRYDQTPTADARRPTAIHGAAATQKRPRYSGIDRLIEEIGTDKDARAGKLADAVQAVANFNDRTNKRVQWLDAASETARNNASNDDERITSFRKRSNSTRRAIEDVSEYDSTARLSRERYSAIRERYSEIGGRIEGVSERTEKNRAVTSENNRLTDRNTDGAERVKQIAGQVRELIQAKELERARSVTRSRSPSMGR